MDEAGLCDRIGLIQNGRFLEIETPATIVSRYENKLWAVQSDDMPKLLNDLRSNEMTKDCFAFGDKHHVSINNKQLTMDNLNEYLIQKEHTNIHIFEIKPSIEDCFMELSQK
jgi:ABC-type multidrug transport system ATPase subunit